MYCIWIFTPKNTFASGIEFSLYLGSKFMPIAQSEVNNFSWGPVSPNTDIDI